MTAAFALLSGVLLALGAARQPCVAWLCLAAASAAGVFLSPLRVVATARGLAWSLAGMTMAWIATLDWQTRHLATGQPDVRLLLEGTVSTVPSRAGNDLGFEAEVQVLEGPGADGRWRRARLAWRDPPALPRVGERWQWVARLGNAAELRNFQGADTQRLAFRNGIHFTARVLTAAYDQRLELAHDGIDVRRARIAQRIADRVADPDAAGLITALAIGLTDGVSRDQWRVFNATGTTHLVAISGLHITMFAMLAFGVARRAWRLLPGRRMEREPFAVLLGLLAAGGYSWLSGWSVPTQRTWLMLAIFAGARLAARPTDAARTWSLALIAVLLLDVCAPLAAGFWLSFVAVGVLLLESTVLVAEPRARRALNLQLAVMLALAPLTFAVFGGVSLVGLAVNLVAIPVISLLFVPVVLAGALAAGWCPVLDAWPFALADWMYEKLWPMLAWAADLDFATWRLQPPGWWFLAVLPAVLLGLRRWPLPLRLTPAAMALPLLFPPLRMPEPGQVRVQVFDAGRGSAVLLTTHAHAVLFDTGDGWNTAGARMARVVLPALDARGLTGVDLLVLPRLDEDRARGAALLANERGLRRILVGGGWPFPSLPAEACRDSRFEWDAALFETFVAGPHAEYCVLRVSVGGHSLLLAGDLDAPAERGLIARWDSRALASDVVTVSRQAAAHASAPEWIEATRAGLAIATGGIAGSDSRARTLARWRAAGVPLLDTRADGGIEFVFGTQGIGAPSVARTARYPFAWRRE